MELTSKNCKNAILKLLASDKSFSEKKIRKSLKDLFESATVDNLDTILTKSLKILLKKGKIADLNGKFTLPASDNESMKRKSEEISANIENVNNNENYSLTKRKKENKSNDDDENATKDAINVKSANTTEIDYKGELWKYGEQVWRDNMLDQSYLTSNPDRITRLFCGNLNKKITEDQLKNAIPGIMHIKWIIDKGTKEFYGTTFLEMKDPEAAAAALQLDRSKLLGRPLKIYYCPPRPGDVWPPVDSGSNYRANLSSNSNNNNNKSSGSGGGTNRQPKERSVKPKDCVKLYCGNLSYDIDDDSMCDFFKDCGEMVGLRWLTDKDTGNFKGCGFIQFSTTEAADQAILLDGKELLGRPIRLDWSE